jgi:hypothetical protein
MPESTYLQYHRRLTLPDGTTKQSKQCTRFDTLGANEYIIGSYAGTEDTIHVDTVSIPQSQSQSQSDSVVNAWLEKKRLPRIQDFNKSIPAPPTSFSILYPATTLDDNDNEKEDDNLTRELMIPFIICTDNHSEVAWIVEGDKAIDPDPKGSACIPGSADYKKLAEEVMSKYLGEEGKWNGR